MTDWSFQNIARLLQLSIIIRKRFAMAHGIFEVACLILFYNYHPYVLIGR